jgi:pSer/pThr/pTyr-binding forkhead associated (FHA) protein
MIHYKPFFDTTIPNSWIAFLMGTHSRLGSGSVLQYFPLELIRYILLFIKEPKVPYLIDLGSMCGTYVKVSNSNPLELEKGQSFLVGSDVIIEIDSLDTSKSNIQSTGFEDFAQKTLTNIEEKAASQGFSYIVIKITKYMSDHDETMQSQIYKFEADQDYKKFTIGRSQVCDIQLSENTISRTQCRVLYTKRKWVLLDGIETKPTVNGTWLSINSYRDARQQNFPFENRTPRQRSLPFSLQKKSQIKVSDTILEVDWD